MDFNTTRLLVFMLTFVSYALFHVSRKTLSGVKTSIADDWTKYNHFVPSRSEAQNFLGVLDSVFMGAYAIALFFWGWLGDRLNPRNVVVFGMITSSLFLVAFACLPKIFHFYSSSYYLITYFLFGVFQACGWPNEIAIMGNWFTNTNRGFVLGLWSSCQSIGNIAGALLVAVILPAGYEYTFGFNSLLMVLASFVIAFFLKDKPDGSVYSAISNPDEFHVTPSLSQGIGLFQALLLPNVIPYCLCNGCLKLVNYAFFFWLPYYMTTQYGWTEAGANYVAAFYDVGGIIGSLVGGIISDRMGSRSPVVVIMLVLSLGSLFLFTEAGGGVLLNVLLMAMVGLTISGPYNLIVSTISIDLGSQSVLSGNAKAMATVSGLIDGTGSIGSAAGQLIVPIIQNVFGWNTVFYLFVLLNGIAILCLTPKFFVDVGFLPTRRLHRRESEPLLSTAD